MKKNDFMYQISKLKSKLTFLVMLVGFLLIQKNQVNAQNLGGRLFSTTPSSSTSEFSYALPQEYEIAGISVSGSQ